MKKIYIIYAIIFCGLFAFNAYPQPQTIVWSDDFESGGGDWAASNGVWAIGVPNQADPMRLIVAPNVQQQY